MADAPRLVQKGGGKISHFFCDGGKMGWRRKKISKGEESAVQRGRGGGGEEVGKKALSVCLEIVVRVIRKNQYQMYLLLLIVN